MHAQIQHKSDSNIFANPDYHGDGYCSWNIPAQCWSKAEWSEDTICIFYYTEDDRWAGHTEHDQCIHRDLDDDEVAQIVDELKLRK